MIDSCGLHIGCFLTCTSGVNTLSVDLLATVSGTHQIEYHFLSRVIRFDIEATIGQRFEIPTINFNESGDARIKIILPSGAYFTYTVGTTVYDTFYLTVRQSTDTNFVPAVIPPVVDGVAIPVNYLMSEQVWPFSTWFGQVIYWRTWNFTAGLIGTYTGLAIVDTDRIIKHETFVFDSASLRWDEVGIGLKDNGGAFWETTSAFGATKTEIYSTVWYTKP